MEDMVQPWYCAYSSVDDVMKYELLSVVRNLLISCVVRNLLIS